MNTLEFFESLTEEDRIILLECALQGLYDEIEDGFMREGHCLEDIAEWVLIDLRDDLAEFMGKV